MFTIKKLKSFNLLNTIILLILILTFVNLLNYVWINKDKYLEKYDHAKLGKIYSESQYVKGTLATSSIGDDGLFAVAGYYLLFQGGDPSQIHFESPPLGEYLIGLSILVFGNERVISLIYGVLLMLVTYKLTLLVSKNKLISTTTIFLLSSDKLFQQQLSMSLLDLPQSLFFILGLYVFIVGLKRNKIFIILASLLFGVAFTIKFFPVLIFLIALFIFWIFKTDISKFKLFLLSLLVIPVIYLVSYSVYFYYHPSFIGFINFQKWVIIWRSGNPVKIGNIIFTFLIGRYRSWWDSSWIVFREWTLVNPILLTSSIFLPLVVKNKKNSVLLYLYIIFIIFFMYVLIGTTGVAKYLLPVYPLMYMFMSYFVINFFHLNNVFRRK